MPVPGHGVNNLALSPLTLLLLLTTRQQGQAAAPDARSDSSPTPAEREPLDALTAWIDANLNQPIDLGTLEEQAGCSRRTLQYHFRRRFDCTPMQWVRRQRLEQALQRLQRPALLDSVWSVAQIVGYTNLSAFSRDFRQHHGLRPSDVLRSARSHTPQNR